ncbi:OLC1v1004435C1 [Oldenlandia corymbosa var. corymbosa]|uniref:OLC1v1004435C1 n=1 Tax=Oldenlandia corymbosa var. corymbosa TaxID=529605 RepID=A0AAV1DEQ3_OLDCO|nr:OLC1v1004435C1 [Oldenlandia corymbosa var. corymbosa]
MSAGTNLPASVAGTNATQQLPPPPPLPAAASTSAVNPGPPKPKSIADIDSPDPVVSWTASIAQQCRKGRLSMAASTFTRMRLSGVEPNHITFLPLLSGCAHFPSQSALSFGSALHGYIRKLGLDTANVKVGSAVIDMYSKFGQMGLARLCFDQMGLRNKVSWNSMINGYMRNGEFEEAVNLFDEMPVKDAISWTALISGFTKQGLLEEAFVWFREMQLSGAEPDFVTLISLLSAVANLGMLGLGLWLHRYILLRDYRDNLRLNNSLIDMYCRCGRVDLARRVFETMSRHNLVSWNSIIVGLAINGEAKDSVEHFKSMRNEGFEPDSVSFTGVLTACSHAGLVQQGLDLFSDMIRVHKISPRVEHFGCIVDLFGRAGMLEDAMRVIESMPMIPNEIILGSLFSACRNRGDVKLAERLMTHLDGDSNHVMLSNIYAALGNWSGASKVRKLMKTVGIQKKLGISSIEVDCVVHEFVAGDKSHPETVYIYDMLDLLSFELVGVPGHLGHQTNKFMESHEFD